MSVTRVLLFSAAAFASAVLMFSLEPLLAKMLLPALGGAPAVWNASLVFFQATLLAGYALAHALSRLGPKLDAIVHTLLVAAAWLALPIHLHTSLGAAWPPVLRVIGVLMLGAGLPFLALSTNASALGRRLASLPNAGDPYFLYAASNAGSLVALLAYPFLVERLLPISRQIAIVGVVYAALVALLTGTAVVALRAKATDAAPSERSLPVSWRRKLRWVALAAVPSAYLVAVTQFFTTNVTPAPLLWVLPLLAYLTSFVLVFARRLRPSHALTARVLPLAAAMAVLTLVMELSQPAPIIVAIHLVTFFLGAMVCHGELVDDRPMPDRLTEFYLWMSAGGVLGGFAVALIAPAVLDRDAEYPLLVVLALLLRPVPKAEATAPPRASRRERMSDAATGLGALVLTLGVIRIVAVTHATGILLIVPLAVPVIAIYRTLVRPARFALGMGAILLASATYEPLGHAMLRTRNFFGALRVARDPTGQFVQLVHGTTIHGRQSTNAAFRREPTSYYHPTGPAGDVFARHAESPGSGRVAVVGLGTGSLAAYAARGEHWTFYEINPAVVQIATDDRYFTFLSDAFPGGDGGRIEVGDARLQLGQTDDRFAVLVIDAFTSDAVPVHLLTAEAMHLYASRLEPGGLLAFHCSNQYLDLEPVIAWLARDEAFVATIREDLRISDELAARGKDPSVWIVMARTPGDLGSKLTSVPWRAAATGSLPGAWTDDASSIVPLLKL